jgi:hypothetical protein
MWLKLGNNERATEWLLKADEISRSIAAFDVTVVSGPPCIVAGRETPELSTFANKGVEDASAAADDDDDEEVIAMQLDPKFIGLDLFPEPGTEEGEMKPYATED